MLTPIPDATYVPDLDAARIPGALIGMTGFAPLQRGTYGSVSTNNTFALTNDVGESYSDVLHAATFRQVNNSVRLLLFRQQNIDEYTSSGTRDNCGTGYNAATTGWSAAAWGNNIYACNYLDATQVSTGTTFTAVGDDCPKARYVAANVNFVMVADTDDGADQYSDQVWWSALQNPTDWTPSIATQAGNVRLLDAPGPITALVAFRDMFVAFKENAIFVGEYVGPPFVFQWRMVSSRIGLSAPKAVCELDGALYFVHTSGVYRFDGVQLSNVGLPVWQTILNQMGHNAVATAGGNGDMPSPGDEYMATDLSMMRMAGDDVEGVLWLSCYTQVVLYSTYHCYLFGFNVRTQKWAALGALNNTGTNPQVLVSTTHSDMRTFLSTDMPAQARVWYVNNAATSYLRDLRYPDAWGNDITGTVATAIQGSVDRSTSAVRIYSRCIAGSDSAPFESAQLLGYANEQRSVNPQSATCVLNAELDCFDGRLASKFKLAYLVGTRSKWCLLAGIGIEYPQQSGR